MDESEYPPEFAELPETSEGDGMGPDNFSSYDLFDHGSRFNAHGEELDYQEEPQSQQRSGSGSSSYSHHDSWSAGSSAPPQRKRPRSYSGPQYSHGTGHGHSNHQTSSHHAPFKGGKRPVVKGPEVDGIANFLAYVCSSDAISNIEVEARLGRFNYESDEKFQNGVIHDDFLRLLSFLEQDEQREVIRLAETAYLDCTEYIYSKDRGKLKITFDNNTKQCLSAVIKNRRTNLNLKTYPNMPYDCSVSISTEDPAQRVEFDKLPNDYNKKKVRKKWSFYKERNIWRIQLTEISTWIRNSKERKEEGEMETAAQDEEGCVLQPHSPIFEVRFELMHDVLESLVRTDRSNLQYIAAKFWQQIHFFSMKLSKGSGISAFARGGARAYISPRDRAGGNYSPHNEQSPYPSPSALAAHPRRQNTGQAFSASSSSSSYRSTQSTRGHSAHSSRGQSRSQSKQSRSSSRSPSLSPSLSPFGGSFSNSTPSPKKVIIQHQPVSPIDSHSYTFPDIHLSLVNPASCEDWKRVVVRLARRWKDEDMRLDDKNLGFPGSLPVNLGRRHWKILQEGDYFVSEKTDGIRYMLFINETGVYLIDRSFRFYAVEGYHQLIQLYATHGPALLDGELVRHHQTQRATFLAFDCLGLNGKSYGSESLTSRLKVIRDLVVVPYRKSIDRGHIDADSHPFVIIGKQFWKKVHARKVFESIKKQKGEEGIEYFYIDDKRYHRTDGLIFTPNSAYTPYSNQALFKWKYLDKCTIDFKIVPTDEEGKYNLACRGKQVDVDCDIAQFPEEDVRRFKADMDKAGLSLGRNKVIVECIYDIDMGQWRYYCLRADKNVANFSRTVFNTLLTIAENVTQEEIMYRILKTPKTDDWHSRKGSPSSLSAIKETPSTTSTTSTQTKQNQVPRITHAPPPSSSSGMSQLKQMQSYQNQRESMHSQRDANHNTISYSSQNYKSANQHQRSQHSSTQRSSTHATSHAMANDFIEDSFNQSSAAFSMENYAPQITKLKREISEESRKNTGMERERKKTKREEAPRNERLPNRERARENERERERGDQRDRRLDKSNQQEPEEKYGAENDSSLKPSLQGTWRGSWEMKGSSTMKTKI